MVASHPSHRLAVIVVMPLPFPNLWPASLPPVSTSALSLSNFTIFRLCFALFFPFPFFSSLLSLSDIFGLLFSFDRTRISIGLSQVTKIQIQKSPPATTTSRSQAPSLYFALSSSPFCFCLPRSAGRADYLHRSNRRVVRFEFHSRASSSSPSSSSSSTSTSS